MIWTRPRRRCSASSTDRLAQPGELGDGQVHLQARALASVRADAVEHLARNVAGVEQAEERALRVGVGQDPVAGDLLASRERHADRPAAADDDRAPPPRRRGSPRPRRVRPRPCARVTAPMPPRTKPQPSLRPTPPDAASCSSPYAVPFHEGPASVLLIDSQPSADFSMSSSNRSSRYRIADVENRKAISCSIRRCRKARAGRCARARAGRRSPVGSGGETSKSGISARAIRCSASSYGGNARASDGDRWRIASTARAGSSSRTKVDPSGYTFSDGPASSTTTPRASSRRSRRTWSRSIDRT